MAGFDLDAVKERIAIRFGREHQVTRGCAACADAMLEVFGATKYAELFDLSDRTRRLDAAGKKFEQLWPAFIDAATAYAGVELDTRT